MSYLQLRFKPPNLYAQCSIFDSGYVYQMKNKKQCLINLHNSNIFYAMYIKKKFSPSTFIIYFIVLGLLL